MERKPEVGKNKHWSDSKEHTWCRGQKIELGSELQVFSEKKLRQFEGSHGQNSHNRETAYTEKEKKKIWISRSKYIALGKNTRFLLLKYSWLTMLC